MNQSTYTIIQACINHQIDECLSVGLILFDDQYVFAQMSGKKIFLCKNIMPAIDYALMKSSLAIIEKAAYSPRPNQFTGIERLSKLSIFNDNLVKFRQPVIIDMPANDETFEFLFAKYIFRNH